MRHSFKKEDKNELSNNCLKWQNMKKMLRLKAFSRISAFFTSIG